MGRPVYSYQRLFRYSLDPSGQLVHKKDGTVSMTVWSRAASRPSFSNASLSSWLSAFWAGALMLAQSTGGLRIILATSNPQPKPNALAFAVMKIGPALIQSLTGLRQREKRQA